MTQAKRRQYGTGSVHPAHKPGCPHHARKDVTKCADVHGCRMRASFYAGFTKTGGHRRPVVTGKTEAEVKRKLKEKMRAYEKGEEAATRTTVKAWSTTWLTETALVVTPKCAQTDRAAARYIVSTIGQRRLEQLTPGDVRAVRDAIVGDGLSTSTALRYHSTLMRMLKQALKEGHTVPARVLAVDAPALAVNDRAAIPRDHALALLSVAAELPHGSRWVAALLQGMRQGECLGLTWEQVDLTAGTLTVSWQLQALEYRIKRNRSSGFRVPGGHESRQVKGRLHLVRPKSKAGWRVMPLVPWMVTALEHWRAICPDSPQGLVWPALDGSPAGTVEDREEWEAIQDTVGVRHPEGRHYLVHEARHTTATLLVELRVDEAVRTQIMGHSTIASTRDYEHRDTTQAREALAQMAERLQLA